MDLTTTYLGLELRNPLLASASPLSNTLDGIKGLADAGVGAVVLYSLFEEQVHRENGSVHYLDLVKRAVDAVEIPIIASLNGATRGGWIEYAKALQDAGAAAIELNIYSLPGDPQTSGREVEERHIDILHAVKAEVSVPVAVKLSPYFSSTGEIAIRLDRAGADALVLFNRFLQPDIDPELLTVTPAVDLSSPAEARPARTWISLLRNQVRADLAATTGVAEPDDVVKYLLAGADVVMTASALLRNGPGYAAVLLDGLTAWMRRKEYASVDDLRGLLAVPRTTDQDAYQRAAYVSALRAADAGHGHRD